MKILARIVMVLLLLSGLGYGSYAFGRYVLSNKLFGNGTTGGLRTVSRATGQASAVTHHTDWKGTRPRVEVKVLPSDENGAPTIVSSDDDSTPRRARTSDESTPQTSSDNSGNDNSQSDNSGVSKNGKKNLDDASVDYSIGNKDGSDSSRRHRRHRRDKSQTVSATAHVDATQNNPTAPEGDGAGSSASTSEAASHDGDHSAISVATDDSVVKTPRAQSTSDATSTPEEKHGTRRHHDRTRSNRSDRSRSTSPVPQPENSAPSHEKSGGDKADISPVPQPE